MLRGAIDWKRWVATLCVALIAFLAIGHVASDYAKERAEFSVSYNITQVEADGPHSAPPHDPLIQTQTDHCCAAHATVLPVVDHVAVALRVSREVATPAETGDAPFATPQGLDRPPRATAPA
jgi:hypothetical protein